LFHAGYRSVTTYDNPPLTLPDFSRQMQLQMQVPRDKYPMPVFD